MQVGAFTGVKWAWKENETLNSFFAYLSLLRILSSCILYISNCYFGCTIAEPLEV